MITCNHSMCIYIYIYMYYLVPGALSLYLHSRRRRTRPFPGRILFSRAQATTSGQKITRRKSQEWNSIGERHWKSVGHFQWKSTGRVTTLLQIPLQSEITLEDATKIPLENATESPRWFLRCWFLVCNLSPLVTCPLLPGRPLPIGSCKWFDNDSNHATTTIYIHTYICVYVCVYTYIYIYIYIHSSNSDNNVWVSVCSCVRCAAPVHRVQFLCLSMAHRPRRGDPKRGIQKKNKTFNLSDLKVIVKRFVGRILLSGSPLGGQWTVRELTGFQTGSTYYDYYYYYDSLLCIILLWLLCSMFSMIFNVIIIIIITVIVVTITRRVSAWILYDIYIYIYIYALPDPRSCAPAPPGSAGRCARCFSPASLPRR